MRIFIKGFYKTTSDYPFRVFFVGTGLALSYCGLCNHARSKIELGNTPGWSRAAMEWNVEARVGGWEHSKEHIMRIVGKMINTLGTGENRAARSRALQKRIKASWTATGIVLLALVLSPSIANASSILGGSDLLNIAGADLLEGWLGEGELVFTNIFDKVPGDGNNSLSFHAAVDGRGRTFSLIEVIDGSGNTLEVIGGYNPQSWSSIGSSNGTPLDSERTAFIFNLTDSTIQRQILGAGNVGYGVIQTFNSSSYGPMFGGHDINVDSSLSRGYTYAISYGTDGVWGYADSITGIMSNDLRIGDIEVFTIALENTPAVVPIPAAAPMVLLGMGLVAALRRRKTSLQA